MRVTLSDTDAIVPIEHIEHAIVLLDRVLKWTPWDVVDTHIGDRNHLQELRDALVAAESAVHARPSAEGV